MGVVRQGTIGRIMTTRRPRSRKAALGIAGVLAFAGLWEIAARTGWVDPIYLPPPTSIIGRLPYLFLEGDLGEDALVSLRALVAGVALGHVIALPAAALAFRFAWLRDLVSPVVELIRGVAPLALLPAFLLLFGLGSGSAIAIIVWCAWVPIFLNYLEGLDAVDRTLVRSARATGARTARLVRSVYIPATLGHYLTGLRLAIGAGWLAVVAAEMLGANAGLGFRILEWSQVFRIGDMYGAIVVIGALGLLMNMMIGLVQRRALRWRIP